MASEKGEASPETSPLKGPAPKAVPEDTSDVAFEDGIPLNPMADPAVQFIPATPANGDAKVEIGDSTGTTPTFVGLGKEELMKYATDPFWVRLRWFLFILFWVLWIAMLAGAIVIIVLAPRCAEKKVQGETYYKIEASVLAKKSPEEITLIKDWGVKSLVVEDALQHAGENPEAVTNFNAFQASLGDGLTSAIEKLKDAGVSVLLRIVPNHSGTDHEWFTDNATSRDSYVWKTTADVGTSVWTTQDNMKTMWQKDAEGRVDYSDMSYLQQFSGNVADLNFRNDKIIEAFKETLKDWRGKGFSGFSIGKASYLVEDLTNLMNINATRNQPENVNVLSKIVGSSTDGNLIDLDMASDEVVQKYIDAGFTPVIKSIDASSAESVQKFLEMVHSHPKVVVDLTKPLSSGKGDIVNMLVAGVGSHTLHNASDSEPLKKLAQFKEKNPRGKSGTLTFYTTGNIVAAVRSESDGEKHLILANLGQQPADFHSTEVGNGKITMIVPNNPSALEQPFSGHLAVPPLTGYIITLEQKEA